VTGRGRRSDRAVVGDLDVQPPVRAGDLGLGPRVRAGVAHDVGQSLLNDAVGRRAGRVGRVPDRGSNVERHVQPAGSERGRQRRQVRDARRPLRVADGGERDEDNSVDELVAHVCCDVQAKGVSCPRPADQ